MKRTVLIFPDTASIAEFILKFKVSGAEVNSRDQSLSAILTDQEIIEACKHYGATFNTMSSPIYSVGEFDE